MRRLLIGLVRLYQRFLSPLLPRLCRFDQSCSHYSVEALQRHGAWRGSWLTVRRLLRCQPFYRGGPVDPVPEEATFFGGTKKPARPDDGPERAGD